MSYIRNSMDPTRPLEIIPLLNPAVSHASPSALQRVPDEVRLCWHHKARGTRAVTRRHSTRLRLFPETSCRSGLPSRNSSLHVRCVKRNLRPCVYPSSAGTKHGNHAIQGVHLNWTLPSGQTALVVTGKSCTNTWDSNVRTFGFVHGISSELEREGKFDSTVISSCLLHRRQLLYTINLRLSMIECIWSSRAILTSRRSWQSDISNVSN